MNQKQRQEYIAELLRLKGSLTTHELVSELNVSKMTIGRDLKELESAGVVELFHGGAMYKDVNVLEYPMLVKQDLFVREKQKIAKLAVKDVAEGSSIFLETGTTVLYVALELLHKKNCTFYTNSLSVANHFAKLEKLDFHIVPGKYRSMSDGFLGIETVDYLKDLFFDYSFVGLEGISQDGRMSVHTQEDAVTKQNVIEHARQAILVFDRSKVGKSLSYGMGNIDQAAKVVTDYSEIDSFFDQHLADRPEILTTQ